MAHRALFDAAAWLGFPRLPIRPAVVAGPEAWETFTTNGTTEDIAAARIALVACQEGAEKAQRSDACAFPAGAATDPPPSPGNRTEARRALSAERYSAVAVATPATVRAGAGPRRPAGVTSDGESDG